MKISVLDGEQLNPGDLNWDQLNQLGDVKIYDSTPDEKVIERCEDADIVVTNKIKFDSERINLLPKLECIIVSATGYNIIDTDSARKQNIVVCNSPSYSNDAVAQHVFALILAIYNQVESYAAEVRNGKWSEKDDWSYTNEPLQNLKGKTLGILGFGQIGQMVSKIGQAFGMKIVAHHKHPKRDCKPNMGFVDLETLFKISDVISLHVPLTEDTKHIVNESMLNRMKSTAVLINTGRGPLIDENALYDALSTNKIRAAGLDVMSEEPPPPNHRLYELSNCYITPHIAWAGVVARENLMEIIVQNVKAFIKNAPINVVN